MSAETASLIIKVDSSGAAKATGDLDKLAKQASRTEGAVGKSGSAMAGAFKMAGGALAAIGGAAMLVQIGKSALASADAFSMMSAKLRLVSESGAAAAAVQEKLFAMSQANRQELGATTELYVKLAQSSEELAGKSDVLLAVTDRVSKSLVLSGADANTASAVIRQFSQAMASGALRGDEFISVMEGAPRLMQAVAQSMGVSVGELRKLAAEGKLTRDVMVNALGGVSDSAQQIDDDFSKMPVTVSGAMSQMRNALTQMIGTTDQATGASGALAQAISSFAGLLSSAEVQQGFATMIGGLASTASESMKTGGAVRGLIDTVRDAASELSSLFAEYNRINAEFEGAKHRFTQGQYEARANLMDFYGFDGSGQRIKGQQLGTRGGYVGTVQGGGAYDKDARNREIWAKGNDGAIADRKAWARGNVVGKPVASVGGTGKPKGGGGGRSTGGAGSQTPKISDEQRALDALNQSVARYLENQRESIALEGEKSNLARAKYETEQGQFKNATAAQKEEIINNARLLDLKRAQIDLAEEMAQREKELNVEKAQGRENAQRLIDDMKFELALLTMTNDQRETEIALRQAGAHATEEQRTAIKKLMEDLKIASKKAEEHQDLKDLFVDIGMDINRAGDAVDAFFDKLKRRALEAMAEKAIQWLMKLGKGEGGGESAGGGGFWQTAGNFLGSIFGGGKAGGGYVQKGKTYRVNELRGEYFSPDQNGYVHNGKQGNSAINSNVSITVNIAQDGTQKTLSKSDGTAVANAARSVAEVAINDALRPGGRIRNAILERA